MDVLFDILLTISVIILLLMHLKITNKMADIAKLKKRVIELESRKVEHYTKQGYSFLIAKCMKSIERRTAKNLRKTIKKLEA